MINRELRFKYEQNKPSTSISRGIPRCRSATSNAFSNRSRISIRVTRRKSTNSGRIEYINALKAKPSRQLVVKSRTSHPSIFLIKGKQSNDYYLS